MKVSNKFMAVVSGTAASGFLAAVLHSGGPVSSYLAIPFFTSIAIHFGINAIREGDPGDQKSLQSELRHQAMSGSTPTPPK